jgi:hypothetical protein
MLYSALFDVDKRGIRRAALVEMPDISLGVFLLIFKSGKLTMFYVSPASSSVPGSACGIFPF